MKLAVSMWSYVRLWKEDAIDVPAFIREAKRIGADGVELLDFFIPDPKIQGVRAREALADTGLPCPIFSVAQNFAMPVEEDRKAELQKIVAGMDQAAQFGAKTVRVFSGDLAAGMDFDQAFDWIVSGLTDAANIAEPRGLRLALENHGKLAGTAKQVRNVIDAVRQNCGHDALGANPDTGNFVLSGDDPVKACTSLADVAHMAHAKDFAPALPTDTNAYAGLDGQRWVGTELGKGRVDVRGCLSAMKDGGFDGWASIEYEGEGDVKAEVAASLDFIRRAV